MTSSTPAVSWPLMKILPDDGAIRRLIIFIVVVLPQPEGPSSTHTAPAGTSMSTLSTAVTVPKTLLTRSSRIMRPSSPGEVSARCSASSAKSATIASRLTASAPVSSWRISVCEMPREMKVPSPPAPI